MGDEFTPEELVVLGETPEPTPEVQAPPEGEKPAEVTPPAEGTPPPEKEPEQTEEEKVAAEKDGFKIDGKFLVDSEGTKIPLERWRKFYAKAKDVERGQAESQRKLNLFKELGADRFYELYPEEKPAGHKPAAREEQTPTIPANMGAMVVQGGPYNGQTLNEVYQQDPAYATSMQNQYLDGQREKVTSVTKMREDMKREADTEITAFSDQLSTDIFGKKAGELSKEEGAKIAESIQATLDWMARTKRGAGIIADAYFLMNRENILKAAHEKGGKAALASLTKPAIASIDTGGGKGPVGMDAFEAMTSDQLASKVEGMTEKEYAKFLKDAPASLKTKHPGLPWD